MMKCAVYCRVSTEMQKDNYSVEIQKKRGIEYAKINGYDYTIYSDVESGSSIQRPAFRNLIKDIEEGEIQVVFVVEFSRLSRNDEEDALFIRHLFVEKKVQLIENGTSILFDSPEDKLFYSIRSSVAAYERRKIVERMQNGMIQKYSKGERKQPKVFGYDNIDGNIIINDDERDTVLEVFNRVAKGETYGQIANDLMLRGKKRKGGKTNWNTAALSKMLRQIVYTGQIKAPNGEIIKSVHYDKMISDELWEATRKQLVERTEYRDKLKVRRGQFELSGLIECKNCNAKYFRKNNYKNGKERGFYIHMTNSPTRLECKNNLEQTTLDEIKVNYLVRAIYLKNFEDYDAVKGFYHEEISKIEMDNNDILQKIEEMKLHRKKLDADKNKLIDAVLSGALSHDDIRVKRDEIESNIHNVEAAIDRLNLVINQSKNFLETLDDFSEKELLDFWDLSGQQRKDLYAKRIKSTQVHNRSLEITFLNNASYKIDDIYNLDDYWQNQFDTVAEYYKP